MRVDGRNNDELRPVIITPGYVQYPEGSVLIEMGATRVICNVTVEERVPGWLQARDQGWITAEYALLPRSTHERTPRETRGLRGRTQEIRRFIGRSLRAAVNLDAAFDLLQSEPEPESEATADPDAGLAESQLPESGQPPGDER